MSVAFRSSDSYNSGASTTSSVVINAPAGMAAYDYIIIAIITSGTPTITPPSGWTLRTTAVNMSTGTAQLSEYWKLASSSEPSTYTFSLSVASNATAVIAAYSGVDRLSPNAGVGSTGVGSGTTTNTPGTPPQVDQPYQIMIAASVNSTAAVTVTGVSTGFTKRVDASTTASLFVEAAISDGPPASTRLDSVGGTGDTFSGSTTANVITSMFLRADTSAATTPSISYTVFISGGNGVSSSAVSTSLPTPGYLYLLIFIQDGTNTVTSITTTGQTWTKVTAVRGAGGPGLEIWQTYISTVNSTTNTSTTVNYSGSVIVNIVPYIFANAMIGTFTAASGSSTSHAASLTTTANNALVLSALLRNPNNPGSIAGGMTLLQLASQSGSGSNYGTSKTTGLVATAGTSVTHTYSDVSSSNWALVIFELIPYVNKTNFFSDLGT